MTYKTLNHLGDVKIFVKGEDLKSLFLNSLRAMFGLITGEDVSVFKDLKNGTIRNFTIKSVSVDILLADFLSQALSFSDLYSEFYFDVHFDHIDRNFISGFFLGFPLEKKSLEIKGVTYHDLKVLENQDKNWEAIILFDI